MNEEKLTLVVESLRHIVLSRGGGHGFSASELLRICPSYRMLKKDERFRVLVMLAKVPGLSSQVGDNGEWRFYPQSHAPDHAFSITRGPKRAVCEQCGRKIDPAIGVCIECSPSRPA